MGDADTTAPRTISTIATDTDTTNGGGSGGGGGAGTTTAIPATTATAAAAAAAAAANFRLYLRATERVWGLHSHDEFLTERRRSIPNPATAQS